jgi:hypothetical protein
VKAFGAWLDEHKWARDLDKKTRNDLYWCTDRRNKIERWRETLATNERVKLNHPTAMKRRYEQTSAVKDNTAAPKGETRTQKLEREIDRLTDEVAAWRKKAEADGSLFDIKKDSVKDIVHIIVENVSFHRLTTLQRELAGEIARRGAEQKHAR